MFPKISQERNKAVIGKSTRFHIGERMLKALFLFAKLCMAAFTIWYLYAHVWLSKDFSNSLVLLKGSVYGTRAVVLLSCSLLLIFVNWGFEAIKWKTLVDKFHHVSFITSFKAILAGTSVSLWIPNRTGEYIGRVLYVPEGARVKGILATLIGSAAQLIITLILGSAGLLYYIWFSLGNYYLFIAAALLLFIFTVLLFFLFFHIQKIRKFIPHYTWLKPLRKYARIYKEYSSNDLGKVLHFSFLRYLVFCSQFLLLAALFGAPIPLLQGFFSLFLIYLIQTAVPTTALTELGLRGVTTVFFFKAYTANIAGVMAASYTLWFINLAIPGLIGLVFLLLARMDRKDMHGNSIM